MESIIRPLAVYFVLYVLFRLAGKRSLASITAFDFVLLLIVAESVQQALIGNDQSMTNAFLVVLTLVAIDIALSLVNQRSPKFRKVMDDVPLILLENGVLKRDRMKLARVKDEDILHAARQVQGLERLDQIKYAILETSGGISIIPIDSSSQGEQPEQQQ